MKEKCLFCFVIICLFVLSFTPTSAQDYVLARFDRGAVNALENYMPGGFGDYLTSCTYFQRSWDPVGPSGGWLANQFRAPDIAHPTPEGPEGRNALFGNSNEGASTREGYWIWFNPAITGSFTFEVFFRLDNLNPAFAEYKMSNIVSSFWMSDNKAVELRYFGDQSPFNAGMIQVMTSDGSTEHNITSSAGLITAGTWYFAAVVYDHVASQISFYLADASDPDNITPNPIGSSVDPNWVTFSMPWLCLAAWPNPAGSCRDITGYIDCFALSYEVLLPANFRLLNLPELPEQQSADFWSVYY